MTYETDIEFLEEFERWKGEKKVTATDFSPGAFLVDRAKDGAWKRIQAVEDEIEKIEAETDELSEEKVWAITHRIRSVLDE